jgi:hypothetical protein
MQVPYRPKKGVMPPCLRGKTAFEAGKLAQFKPAVEWKRPVGWRKKWPIELQRPDRSFPDGRFTLRVAFEKAE